MSKKVSKIQLDKLISCMENSPQLQKGTLNSSFTAKDKERLWLNVQLELHAVGSCHKSIDKWKECWSQLKTDVKRRYQKHQQYTNRTGGGPPSKPLSALDQRVMAIIGDDMLKGLREVKESATPVIYQLQSVERLDEGVTCETHSSQLSPSFSQPSTSSFVRPLTPIQGLSEDSFIDEGANESPFENNSRICEETQSGKRPAETPPVFRRKRQRRQLSKILSPDKANKLIESQAATNLTLSSICEVLEEKNNLEKRKLDIMEQQNEIKRRKNELLQEKIEVERSRTEMFLQVAEMFLSHFTQ